jgi:hypothetical protein
MAEAEHTFLLKEGLWKAAGEFVDGMGKATAVQGEAQIRHNPDQWIYEGVMRAATTPPTELSRCRDPSRRPATRHAPS